MQLEASLDVEGWRKRDGLPYDFARKRLSVLVERGGESLLITKGSLAQVRPRIEQRAQELNARGYRTLGVAVRRLDGAAAISRQSEAAMVFLGLLVFADPPKAGIARTLADLEDLGVRLKIISGDNALVAARVGEEVGQGAGAAGPGARD